MEANVSNKDCVLYSNIITPDSCEAIYESILGATDWSFTLKSQLNYQDEARCPTIQVAWKGESLEISDQSKQVVDLLLPVANQLIEDTYGERFTSPEFVSFQITFDGFHGRPHIDHEDDNYKTCMFFLSPEWDPQWGGLFSIKMSDGSVANLEYTPMAAVCFRSNLLHTGNGGNISAKRLRLTFVVHGHTEAID